MLSKLFGRPRWEEASFGLYSAIVSQARRPEFYTDCAVADTVDGRFDLVTLHAFLVLRRLNGEKALAGLGQVMFDLMFNDLDQNLREMGVSDMGMAPKIKKMIKAFYGRVTAYEAGMDDAPELSAALLRNLYRGESPGEAVIAAMVRYLQAEAAGLATQAVDDFKQGRVRFGDPITP